MSNELPEGLCKTMVSGGELIATSMYTCAPMFELSRKKIDEKTGRDNYCKTVLLLWGFMQFELNELEDDMFNRMLLISAGVLNRVLAKKEFNSSCTINFNVDLNITKLNKNCFNIDGRDVRLNILSYFMDGKIKKSFIADNYMNVKNNDSLLFTKKSKLMRSSFLISEK